MSIPASRPDNLRLRNELTSRSVSYNKREKEEGRRKRREEERGGRKGSEEEEGRREGREEGEGWKRGEVGRGVRKRRVGG